MTQKTPDSSSPDSGYYTTIGQAAPADGSNPGRDDLDTAREAANAHAAPPVAAPPAPKSLKERLSDLFKPGQKDTTATGALPTLRSAPTLSPGMRKALKYTGIGALAYASLPIVLPPVAAAGGSYLLWKKRASWMPASIPRTIFWGSALLFAGIVGVRSLADNYERNIPMTSAVTGNAGYLFKSVMNTAGAIASNTAVPCINAPENCLSATLDTLGSAGNNVSETALSLWGDAISGFYGYHYDALKNAFSDADSNALPSERSAPRTATRDADSPAEKPGARTTGKTANLWTTYVELCQPDYSRPPLNQLRSADPENWDLMRSFWHAIEPRLEKEKTDPNSPLSKALAESRKTGQTTLIVYPRIEDYISEYHRLREGGHVSTAAQFNDLVRQLSPNSGHKLNFQVSNQPASARYSQCPKSGHSWVSPEGKPYRIQIEEFMAPKSS